MTAWSARHLILVGYILVLALSFFLLFRHLDRKLLWGDEAETALLTRNVLRFGIPKTVDGLNHITVLGRYRDENTAHVWTWAPWLQEYVTAGSFLVFGESTWSSRAPFAAIAWLSVALLGLVAFRIYRGHFVAVTSLLLIATSEVFLLHARQCRYYSITVAAEILLVYGAFELLEKRKTAPWLMVIALVLQFYTNFVLVVANFPLLLALSWLNRKEPEVLKKLAAVIALTAAAALPWLIYARPWDQAKAVTHENLLSNVLYYFGEWHFHFIPWIFLLLPLSPLLVRRSAKHADLNASVLKLEKACVILMIGYFIPLLALEPELRYLLPLLPVGCLLTAAWLFRYVRFKAAIATVLALQTTTNVVPIVTTLGLNKQHYWRAPIVEFVTSLSHTYTDAFSDVLSFFSSNAKAGEIVWVPDPEFPLIFYTGLGVIDARIATPQALPDWILPQSASGLLERQLAVPESIKSNYETVTLSVHDSDRFDNVPEPDVYQYWTATKLTRFLIYRKIK